VTERISGRVVTPSGVVDGWISVADGRITAVAPADPVGGGPGQVSAPGRPGGGDWIVPGFVDIHNHGGGGHSFTLGSAPDAQAAAAFHLAHGTTTLVASLVSSPFSLMRDAVAAFAPLYRSGIIAGIHFEGPYLSTARCGAQNPAHLRDPSPEELSELISLGDGAVRMVTLAPERPGALDAIKLLATHGVLAAIGHTDATYEETLAAVAAGATVGTHVFNGMRPPHHREPGPVFALLAADSVVCELIADGVHLHDGTLSFAVGVAGPARAALITDAMAAADMPDGRYSLGGQTVLVADRIARLERDGTIAGSTLTMAAALRRAVGAGISIVAACRMASTTPARVLGLSARIGALAPGLRADLVVLSEDLHVKRVMRAGAWLP
jgi:N-acetylglucosamine-6-phosphate deacetylase